MSIFPKMKQWRAWSLPSKMTAIGTYLGIIGLLMTLAGPAADWLRKWNEGRRENTITLEYLHRLSPSQDMALIHRLVSSSNYPKAAASAIPHPESYTDIVTFFTIFLQGWDYRVFRLKITNRKPYPIFYSDIGVAKAKIDYPFTPDEGYGVSVLTYLLDNDGREVRPSRSINIAPFQTCELILIAGIWQPPNRCAKLAMHSNSLQRLSRMNLASSELMQYCLSNGWNHGYCDPGEKTSEKSCFILSSVLEEEYVSRGLLRHFKIKLTDDRSRKVVVEARLFDTSQNGSNVIIRVNY